MKNTISRFKPRYRLTMQKMIDLANPASTTLLEVAKSEPAITAFIQKDIHPTGPLFHTEFALRGKRVSVTFKYTPQSKFDQDENSGIFLPDEGKAILASQCPDHGTIKIENECPIKEEDFPFYKDVKAVLDFATITARKDLKVSFHHIPVHMISHRTEKGKIYAVGISALRHQNPDPPSGGRRRRTFEFPSLFGGFGDFVPQPAHTCTL
jgi:hypothetical protein